MTVREIAAYLTDAGIDRLDAIHEARLLVSHFTGLSATHVAAFPDEEHDSAVLAEAVERRTGRYPLQYLLGKWEFFGLSFAVDEHTLIPRPDTERIAEAAIAYCPANGAVLDLCTGSGCIAAAVLANVPSAKGTAVDLYPDTLAAAKRNLEALGLASRCAFLRGDATTDLFPENVRFDVIVSNPPYVTASEMEELAPELSYEPAYALTDGGDGLSILAKEIEIYWKHLAENGAMILEHGWQQADAVGRIADSFRLQHESLVDYGGNTRGIVIFPPK